MKLGMIFMALLIFAGCVTTVTKRTTRFTTQPATNPGSSQ